MCFATKIKSIKPVLSILNLLCPSLEDETALLKYSHFWQLLTEKQKLIIFGYRTMCSTKKQRYMTILWPNLVWFHNMSFGATIFVVWKAAARTKINQHLQLSGVTLGHEIQSIPCFNKNTDSLEHLPAIRGKPLFNFKYQLRCSQNSESGQQVCLLTVGLFTYRDIS